MFSYNLGLPISLILHNGLEVSQHFKQTETIKVKPFYYTKNLLNFPCLL
jgi:hypothetical protein